MSNIKISQLDTLNERTEGDLVPIVDTQTGITKKIAISDFNREPVTDGGSVSGTIPVDLSLGQWFKFELVGDATVEFSNVVEGKTFLFWVYANGNNTISDMTIVGGGDVYSVSGNLPNPNNNKWNLYQAYSVNGDLVLTEIGNFSAI